MTPIVLNTTTALKRLISLAAFLSYDAICLTWSQYLAEDTFLPSTMLLRIIVCIIWDKIHISVHFK
ncbi:unnamed protein product [Moneuplotes crassus]|uniref:Uncharacterized protein n=1 Tax=Euplotes crassus TaxID=5936 RepID=A0AAD1XX96_EUPCR|nr:unnamed protein product [Moneuplotes crassus]